MPRGNSSNFFGRDFETAYNELNPFVRIFNQETLFHTYKLHSLRESDVQAFFETYASKPIDNLVRILNNPKLFDIFNTTRLNALMEFLRASHFNGKTLLEICLENHENTQAQIVTQILETLSTDPFDRTRIAVLSGNYGHNAYACMQDGNPAVLLAALGLDISLIQFNHKEVKKILEENLPKKLSRIFSVLMARNSDKKSVWDTYLSILKNGQPQIILSQINQLFDLLFVEPFNTKHYPSYPKDITRFIFSEEADSLGMNLSRCLSAISRARSLILQTLINRILDNLEGRWIWISGKREALESILEWITYNKPAMSRQESLGLLQIIQAIASAQLYTTRYNSPTNSSRIIQDFFDKCPIFSEIHQSMEEQEHLQRSILTAARTRNEQTINTVIRNYVITKESAAEDNTAADDLITPVESKPDEVEHKSSNLWSSTEHARLSTVFEGQVKYQGSDSDENSLFATLAEENEEIKHKSGYTPN